MSLKSLVLTITFVVCLGLPALAQGKPEGKIAEPKLVLASFTHDFGEVKSGTPLNYSFIITNQGEADLIIKSVAPG